MAVDGLDLVEELVVLGGHELSILRPRSSEALLDEQAFEREEFLPYWAELWPSGLELARAIAGRALGGSAVVELGCGLALPSISAALAGAQVLATDWSAAAVALAQQNATRNGAVLETAVVAWADPARLVRSGPWQLVLAADVLYERRNCELLLDLLPTLLAERGEMLLVDPGRPLLSRFLEGAAAAGWIVEGPRGAAAGPQLYGLRRGSGGSARDEP